MMTTTYQNEYTIVAVSILQKINDSKNWQEEFFYVKSKTQWSRLSSSFTLFKSKAANYGSYTSHQNDVSI